MRSLGTFLCEQQVGAATGDRHSFVESSALWARITAPHPNFPWASQSVRDSKCPWMWVLWQSASHGCARRLIQLLQHPPWRLTALPGGVWGASETDFGVAQARWLLATTTLMDPSFLHLQACIQYHRVTPSPWFDFWKFSEILAQ